MQFSIGENSTISQNHRMGQVGKDHSGPFGPTSLLKQGYPTAYCTGLHPDSSWILPVGETPHPLCSSARSPAQKRRYSSCSGGTSWASVSSYCLFVLLLGTTKSLMVKSDALDWNPCSTAGAILGLIFHFVLCDALGCCLACSDFASIKKVWYRCVFKQKVIFEKHSWFWLI